MNANDIEVCPKCGDPLRIFERNVCDACVRKFLLETHVSPTTTDTTGRERLQRGDRVRVKPHRALHPGWHGCEGEVYGVATADMTLPGAICVIVEKDGGRTPITIMPKDINDALELVSRTTDREALEAALDELKDVAR